jgi:HAD superfamily hydrolase (TIGR01484 family)
MKYKLLLLDIDGTLVESNGGALPSQVVIDAVAQAQKQLQVSIVTGRPYNSAKPVFDALRIAGLSIFNGGAEIIDVETLKVKQRLPLDVKTLRELTYVALPFGYKVYTDANQYKNALSRPDEITKPAAKLFIEAVTTQDAIRLLEQLNGVPGASAHPTTSWSKGDVVDIHVTHEHATKRHAVERLSALLGLTKDQVIAIGDSHNDVPLLEAAGLKVVMGNAPSEIKALADYVAPSLANDGVANVISRFVLE